MLTGRYQQIPTYYENKSINYIKSAVENIIINSNQYKKEQIDLLEVSYPIVAF